MPTKINPYTQIQGFGIITPVTMTSADVTLTPAQWINQIIVITGTLTANVNLIFPNIVGQWLVVNNTTGAHTITAKTAAGTGYIVPQLVTSPVYGDATNIYSANNAVFGINQTRQDVTGSRALNTSYTNSTGRPIFVAVQMNVGGGVGTVEAFLQAPYGGFGMSSFIAPGGGGTLITALNGIVLPGETYGVSTTGTPVSLSWWLEIR